MKRIKLAIVAMLIVVCAAATVGCFGGNSTPVAALKAYTSGTSSFNHKKAAGALYVKGSKEYDAWVKVAEDEEKAMETAGIKKSDVKMTITVKKTNIVISGETATGSATVNIKGKVKVGAISSSIDVKDAELKNLAFKSIDGKWYLNELSFDAAMGLAMLAG